MKRLISLIPLILTVALVAAACGDDSSSTDAGGLGNESSTTTTTTTTTTTPPNPDTPEGALAAARQRWIDRGLTSYRLASSEICFCPDTSWINTVVDGEVIGHEPTGEQSSFDPGPRSMETLFDEIEAAIARGYATLDAEYNPETGAVVSYYVDVDVMTADEEYGVQVTSVTPHDPSVPTVVIESAALVDDYGCGYGFAKGDATQELALVIYWKGGFDPEGPDVTAPIALPTPDWVARISTGADLFANWCDDAIEPDEPTPIELETWTLVTGTLTVTSDPGVASCGGAEVTATLTGATAESENGSRVDLDAIALRNTAWGCFAG